MGIYLVYVPKNKRVKNYMELSRIVTKLGWKIFIDCSRNVWVTWYLPPDHTSVIPMVVLPHPLISLATYDQLVDMKRAFTPHIFNITYTRTNFVETAFYRQLPKPILLLRSTRYVIHTIHGLAEELEHHGWIQQAHNEFVKRERVHRYPGFFYNMIKIPAVRNLNQLSAEYIVYIQLVTDNIFILKTPTSRNC